MTVMSGSRGAGEGLSLVHLNQDVTISDVGVGCGLKDDTDTHCWKIWMILIKIR